MRYLRACAHILINALKLLANQQEDNDRALDVGELLRGTGALKVRKSKVPEGGSEVTIRESPDELTLRGGRS